METTNTIAVQVVVVPAAPKAVVLEPGATVADAARAAGASTDGYAARRAGAQVSLDAAVQNGDIIYLARQLKGNA